MCDPVVASFGSGAINAIGGAQAAKKENERQQKIREAGGHRDRYVGIWRNEIFFS